MVVVAHSYSNNRLVKCRNLYRTQVTNETGNNCSLSCVMSQLSRCKADENYKTTNLNMVGIISVALPIKSHFVLDISILAYKATKNVSFFEISLMKSYNNSI